MLRHTITPRPGWQGIVESQGFHFHSMGDQPYWDESACYSFTSAEIDVIETATAELHALCLEAVGEVIRRGQLGRFGIPAAYQGMVADSWYGDAPTLYGRFDLAFGAEEGLTPKMLEYNADTPTSLLEAAVVQWFWLRDTRPGKDQFNSLHEKLIAAWQWFKERGHPRVHFASVAESIEDFMTVTYLRDTAEQAGVETEYLAVEQIGYHWKREKFVDLRAREIRSCFKLYPWEWMVEEEFGPLLLKPAAKGSGTRWIEPAWKMLLSNKALLPVLWEMFPGHPNLLEASFEPMGGDCVRKPLLSREGANVAILRDGRTLMETKGRYDGPCVYQRRAAISKQAGNYAVLGSWIIGDEPGGMGIREDGSPVTGNLSRFLPHYIE